MRWEQLSQDECSFAGDTTCDPLLGVGHGLPHTVSVGPGFGGCGAGGCAQGCHTVGCHLAVSWGCTLPPRRLSHMLSLSSGASLEAGSQGGSGVTWRCASLLPCPLSEAGHHALPRTQGPQRRVSGHRGMSMDLGRFQADSVKVEKERVCVGKRQNPPRRD